MYDKIIFSLRSARLARLYRNAPGKRNIKVPNSIKTRCFLYIAAGYHIIKDCMQLNHDIIGQEVLFISYYNIC